MAFAEDYDALERVIPSLPEGPLNEVLPRKCGEKTAPKKHLKLFLK